MTKDDINSLFKEWDLLMYIINQSEVKLYYLKKDYDQAEQKILNETDFKELYGANNDKIRRNHVKKELANQVEEIAFLELALANAKRKISYLKSYISAQIEFYKNEGEDFDE